MGWLGPNTCVQIGIANGAALWVFIHSNKLNPEIYIVSGLAVILGSLLGQDR